MYHSVHNVVEIRLKQRPIFTQTQAADGSKFRSVHFAQNQSSKEDCGMKAKCHNTYTENTHKYSANTTRSAITNYSIRLRD